MADKNNSQPDVNEQIKVRMDKLAALQEAGCLAAAGRTEQCDEFILTDVEVQIVQNDIVTVGFGNVHKIDQFFAHSGESFLNICRMLPHVCGRSMIC